MAESASSQERVRNRRPFLLQRGSTDRLAGAAVPIGGVAGVALLAVQVSVDPVPCPALVRLRRLVRAVPVALGVAPKRDERQVQIGRRGSRGQCGAEGGEIHFMSLAYEEVPVKRSRQRKALRIFFTSSRSRRAGRRTRS